MRRSSCGTGPLRVRNDGDAQTKPRSRLSGDNRLSSGSRKLSTGSRTSFGAAGKSHSSMTTAGPPTKRRTTSKFYGMNDVRQDPRPVSERSFRERAIRNLIEFLAANSYPHPYSPKLLHSPQSKDFVRIFEFIYSILEPGFKCTKIEEQFPHIMKELGYPFPISKSAMYAIGSPHMWPNLLAALDWLRGQIQHSMNLDVEELMFAAGAEEDFDSVPMSKLVFHYCTSSYTKFLEGADTFKDIEANLAKEISKNSAGGDMESLIHENRRLRIELDSLDKQTDPLIDAQDKLASLRLDHHKISSYNQQLDNHSSQLLTAVRSLEDEVKASEAEFAVLYDDNRKKQAILATQVFSQADVERINMERRTLKQQIDSVEGENESIQNLIWDEERNIAKDTEKLYKKCTEYNQKARLLHLIPATEENAHGIDFEMHHTLEESHSNHFRNTIKPAWSHLNNQEMDKLNELEESRIRSQSVLDQLSDNINDKVETCKSLEKKLQESDEKLERQKRTQNQELSNVQLEIDSVHDQLIDIHREDAPDVQRLQLNVQMEKHRFEQMKVDDLKSTRELVDFTNTAIRLVVDHKTVIQEYLQNLKDESVKRLAEEKKHDNMD